MNTSSSTALDPVRLRAASTCQTLHWLAAGRIDAVSLAEHYLAAIANRNPALNAYISLRPEITRAQAADSAQRRAAGRLRGRLDGIPVAIKDNIDVAGWVTTAGLPARREQVATGDAAVVERLLGAGAVILGKTNLDEGVLGASTNNPHYGATRNPWQPDYGVGGSSGGAAAAVAAGLCVAAIGTDSLGSVRIPASHCGVFALKPTHGEISARGLVPAARRLDTIGLVARSVDDLTVLLQVLAGYDAEDPRSRKRRVALAPPDWEPGRLRCGIPHDLAGLGTTPAVLAAFDQALASLRHELGQQQTVDFSDYPLAKARRAGLLLMEAEMRQTFAQDLADTQRPLSAAFRGLLDFAAGKSASDYVAADRMLDASVLKARRLFASVDVLVLPTTPCAAARLDQAEPAEQAQFTAFASLSGCPAVTIPMGRTVEGLPLGLQFVGPPGSDLRLLELAEVCAAALDATPDYPAGAI
ncbi:MAG: amidase [Rhodanobacteraceae bacterium]|nr:amidase [Rhodanobacteraceae bacterium]